MEEWEKYPKVLINNFFLHCIKHGSERVEVGQGFSEDGNLAEVQEEIEKHSNANNVGFTNVGINLILIPVGENEECF